MNIQDKMDMIADNPRLLDVKPLHSALQGVIDLHKPRQGHGMNPICDACSDEDDDDAYLYYESGPTFIVWPCPTVRAIENTLKEYM